MKYFEKMTANYLLFCFITLIKIFFKKTKDWNKHLNFLSIVQVLDLRGLNKIIRYFGLKI